MLRENVEKQVIEKLNDPSSYEFVSLKVIDSTTYAENIAERRRTIERNMGLSFNDSLKEEQLKENILILKNIEDEMGESVSKIPAYTYLYSFRGKNAMGAKVLQEYYVQSDPEDNILKITEDTGGLLTVPNGFPNSDRLKY